MNRFSGTSSAASSRINWSYVAGLFDTIGFASLKFQRRGLYFAVAPTIVFVTTSSLTEPLRSFLARENVTARVYPAGKLFKVCVSYWEGCKRLYSYIHDEVIEKKSALDLLMAATQLHSKCSAHRVKGKLFAPSDLKELDRIRHEIHKYARRGPKKLREYTLPV